MLGHRMWFALLASVLLHVGLLALASRPLSGKGGAFSPAVSRQVSFEVRLSSSPASETKPVPLRMKAHPPLAVSPAPATRAALSGWDAYRPSSQLDERPQVIADIPIDPPELRQHPEGGTMELTLWIGADGKVDDVTVGMTALPEVFVESAIRGFRSARFKPGLKDGAAVKSKLRIELNYQPLPAPARR